MGLHKRYANILATPPVPSASPLGKTAPVPTASPLGKAAPVPSASPLGKTAPVPSASPLGKITLSFDSSEKLAALFKGMMKALFRQKGATFSIDILTSEEAQNFINTHARILDSSFDKVEMTDTMRKRLTRSNYIFSGIKAFHQLNEAFPSMIDKNGNKKPFEQFLNEVQNINQTYNVNYLHAEYNFVQASATMAAKWEKFEEDGDRYLLQYRTQKDDKVRPEHAALDGVTLPMSDPFWESYYPPNGWNCFYQGTPVLTANGWKNIDSIKKGELVVGGSGEFREVTATLARPFKGELVTIITKGEKTTCTPNHRFCTRRGWIAAENLNKGDIIIQIGKNTTLNLVVQAVSNAYTILRYGMMASIRKGKAVATLAVNHKIERRNEKINNVTSNKLTNFERDAFSNKVMKHDRFAFTHWHPKGAHTLWMKMASRKGVLYRLPSYRWSKKRRTMLQLFRYATNEITVKLGLALTHMEAFDSKFMVRLRKALACFRTTKIVTCPLSSDGITTMPNRNSKLIEEAVHSSAVYHPMRNKPSEASFLGNVSQFCGIKDIHSFNGFYSFFDFLRNTFFHNRYVLVEGKVTEKKQETMVFNLSIDKDETYIVPVGIAHNCRCNVVQVLKSKYKQTPHDEAMGRGETAMQQDKKGIFKFNPGKQGKTVPDYNPYTITKCRNCDVTKDNIKLARVVPENELCQACLILHRLKNEGEQRRLTSEERKSIQESAVTWADKHLPKVTMPDGTTGARLTVHTKDGVELHIGKKFFTETYSKSKNSRRVAETMEVATHINEWIRDAKQIRIEPGRHHAFDFVVFKTVYNNQEIEFKAKSTEGLIVYMMRLL